ncbi:MAG: hypothetical protein LBU31_02990 [Coriobacteriales bacterium]|nr:hypothetical protein [Coriobacteriales bacterium]
MSQTKAMRIMELVVAMRYLTGIYALNVPSSLDADGDWHASALDWTRARTRDSADALFGEWGIEEQSVPTLGMMPVANTVRALLDLLEEGRYGLARGMRDELIANEEYTPLVFALVMQMKCLPNWDEIDRFMGRVEIPTCG